MSANKKLLSKNQAFSNLFQKEKSAMTILYITKAKQLIF